MRLQVKQIPGIVIFRSSATLYFANAEMYTDALYEKVHTLTEAAKHSFTHINKETSHKQQLQLSRLLL